MQNWREYACSSFNGWSALPLDIILFQHKPIMPTNRTKARSYISPHWAKGFRLNEKTNMESPGGKRKRPDEGEEDPEAKRHKLQLLVLEQLISISFDMAMLLVYELPYRTLMHFCNTSTTVLNFCKDHLDITFFLAMWLSDSRRFSQKELDRIDEIGSFIMIANIPRKEWKDLGFVFNYDRRGKVGFHRNVAQSTRIEAIWARYEAILHSQALMYRRVRRAGIAHRRQSHAFFSVVLHRGYLPGLRQDGWWENLIEEDGQLIISGLGEHTFSRFLYAGIPKGTNEIYPGFVVQPRYNKTLMKAIMGYPRNPLPKMANGNFRDEYKTATSLDYLSRPPLLFASEQFEGEVAEPRNIGSEDEEYTRWGIDRLIEHVKQSKEFLHGVRLMLLAIPRDSIKWLGGVPGTRIEVVNANQAIVLLDTEDAPIESVTVDNTTFAFAGEKYLDPAILQFGGRFKLKGTSSVYVPYEFQQNCVRDPGDNPLGYYRLEPGTDQMVVRGFEFNNGADVREQLYTEEFESMWFVDSSDRQRRHKELMAEHEEILPTVTQRIELGMSIVGESDAHRYQMWTATNSQMNESVGILWDSRCNAPRCEHVVSANALSRWLQRGSEELCPECADEHASALSFP